MKLIVMAALTALAAMVTGGCAASNKDMACCDGNKCVGKLRHVVLFQFKEGTPQDQIDMIVSEFGKLQSKLDVIKGYEHGLINNVETELQGGYTHAFVVTFDNRAGLEAYLPSAPHQAFVAKVKPLLEKVHVADYVVE